jgi:hypothetical protein
LSGFKTFNFHLKFPFISGCLRIRLRKREFGDSGGKNEHWHALDAELLALLSHGFQDLAF